MGAHYYVQPQARKYGPTRVMDVIRVHRHHETTHYSHENSDRVRNTGARLSVLLINNSGESK